MALSPRHTKMANRALWQAAEDGDVPACLKAVQSGAEVQSGDSEKAGFTALHLAAAFNNVAVMDYLMRAGSTCHYKGQSGMTPLHIAAEKGHDAAVKSLLAVDADIHSRGPRGWSPVQLACAHGHITVAKRLVTAGSDVRAKGPRGLTALHLAAASGSEATARFLIDEGVDVDARDHMGRTALSWAAADGHEAVVRGLLSANANPALQDKTNFEGDKTLGDDHFAPIHWAASNGHTAVLRQLIKGHADVNLVAGERSLSALHIAAVCGHDVAVELLIASGSFCGVEDADGNTPLQLSRKSAISTMLYEAMATSNA